MTARKPAMDEPQDGWDTRPDEWDSSTVGADTMWFRPLSEHTVEDAVSQTMRIIRITRDAHGYWLGNERTSGESLHATLEEAKIAGDEAWERDHERQSSAILTSAGLCEDEWTVRLGETLLFTRSDGCTIESGSLGWGAGASWTARIADEDDPIGEDAGTIEEAIGRLP